ncbi:MAG TPA: SGNH/GDSL hydrolase family protein [Flavisolibacter sp.]|nr:SGNH/GDSL hydrolase family protein [Flavisolibacter sp.]
MRKNNPRPWMWCKPIMQRRFFRFVLVACVYGLISTDSNAQTESYKWWRLDSTTVAAVEGRAWPGKTESLLDRLPAEVKDSVPAALWSLSHNTAGEVIRFVSNAGNIVVRYVVNGEIAMPHMPATGVSGVDLYAMDENGNFQWAPGRFRFKDTIEYRFTTLNLSDTNTVFQLYLPLYNTVKWLSIGVPAKSNFTALPARSTKPVVVYGTSITQGACASRPGLAWTAILGRKLNLPIINLGFSGNGKMEPAVTDLLNEIDAQLFIIDCMPNLTPSYKIPDAEIEKRFSDAVKKIRLGHPGIPIILAEHSGGYAAGYLDKEKENEFKASSLLVNRIFKKLRGNGVKNLYLVTAKDLGFDLNATVDGLHPNDIGMMLYANTYENLIRKTVPIQINKDPLN